MSLCKGSLHSRGRELESTLPPRRPRTREEDPMAKGHADPNKKYLSHTLAEWACGLRYEHLSEKAVHTAKLFWYDSLGCALGGSGQEDAHILLAHYREMAGSDKGLGP